MVHLAIMDVIFLQSILFINFQLFNDPLSTVDCIYRRMKCEDDYELWVDKHLEGDGSVLLEDIILAFTWKDWESHGNIQSEIRPRFKSCIS
jgi:hypothetical protein